MNFEITTMVMVNDEINNKTLLINHQNRAWKGYSPPGGHLDGLESITDCAVREVKEETGLIISNLTYKGLIHWADTKTGDRYMVYCYTTSTFSGNLSSGTHEGIPEWVDINALDKIPMAEGFMKNHARVLMAKGVHELHLIWNDENDDREDYIEI